MGSLTQEYLKFLFRYDPETGLWTRRMTIGPRKKGTVAGTFDKQGYVVIQIERRVYKAHRLAFFYMLGRWPQKQVDHQNMIKSDNRWENLREATNTQNNGNRKKQLNNTTGHRGVFYHKRNNRWTARVGRNYLGSFDNFADAATARNLAAALEFGEFYRC